ncbi:hypothetical protein GCM10010470_34490 [Saccharopolyspora taberi]|uniref:Uncharacterized protein n=1 Tax=Saccharopolyspora taberi TaxID=60895 RepID=A0ABN3VEA8_9PSEU
MEIISSQFILGRIGSVETLPGRNSRGDGQTARTSGVRIPTPASGTEVADPPSLNGSASSSGSASHLAIPESPAGGRPTYPPLGTPHNMGTITQRDHPVTPAGQSGRDRPRTGRAGPRGLVTQ